MAQAAKAIPDGYHTITPALTLDNAAETIDWYKRALGAEEVSRSESPDGKIMHAELRIGNSRFMVNDVMRGMRGPKEFGGSPASLWVYVDDADAVVGGMLGGVGQRMLTSVSKRMAAEFFGAVDAVLTGTEAAAAAPATSPAEAAGSATPKAPGTGTVYTAPIGAIAPGIALVSLVIGVNLLADGLRDIADPTRRGR